MLLRWRATAVDLVSVQGADCWRELFGASHRVLLPIADIPARTVFPVDASVFVRERDSAPKLKSQSGGRRAEPRRDNRNRTARGHPRRCRECGGIALRRRSADSHLAKMSPRLRGKHCLSRKERSYALRA